jgi:hypothetical protein
VKSAGRSLQNELYARQGKKTFAPTWYFDARS